MGMAFATRAPSAAELEHLRLMLSTFRDGSGSEREPDGTTRAGWRQMERCFAEMLNGEGGEDKQIFDVISIDDSDQSQAYGFSIKSKRLSKAVFESLPTNGRVYMEIANSPAKFLDAVAELHGLYEADFRAQGEAAKFGSCVIDTVHTWHEEGKAQFERENPGVTLNLDKSCYLCISYTKGGNSGEQLFRVDSFPLRYPDGITWRFTSAACLTGFDPAYPNERLIDWYARSGGQLKYYPRATSAKFSAPPFALEMPPKIVTISERAKDLFPKFFK